MVMVAEAEKTANGRIDWRTVRGLMVDAIYGGRVDNPHDMRVLATYLRQYFNSDVVWKTTAYSKWVWNFVSGRTYIILVYMYFTM